MDYLRGKFGDCSFSHFGCIVQTVSRHTADADERFTPATLVGVINKRHFTKRTRQGMEAHPTLKRQCLFSATLFFA